MNIPPIIPQTPTPSPPPFLPQLVKAKGKAVVANNKLLPINIFVNFIFFVLIFIVLIFSEIIFIFHLYYITLFSINARIM